MGLVTSRSVRSEELSSSKKRINIDLLRTGRFCCILHINYVMCDIKDLSRIWFRIGWFDWKLLDSCPTSDRWACSEPNSLFHSCFKEIFGGSRGDMYTFSYMTSPVSIQTIFGFFVNDLSSFHRNNFGNTISWKCSKVKRSHTWMTCGWSADRARTWANVSMDDQRRWNNACMRALSGCTCECACCEAPRNRRCAVCLSSASSLVFTFCFWSHSYNFTWRLNFPCLSYGNSSSNSFPKSFFHICFHCILTAF